jgi:membrane fusion protein (multidrug efflux system)
MSIPSEALIPQMEGEMVYVYRKGKADAVRVGTGLRTESQIQITSGLNFGDTVLASGILQLRQGLPVSLDTLLMSRQ